MKLYSRDQLRAELERRGCTPHPNPGSIVVPIGEVWIHPDRVTRIIIPRSDPHGFYPEEIVRDLLERHNIPEPKPSN